MYLIEKGIPSPQGHLKPGNLTTVLRAMEIGDSILLPEGKNIHALFRPLAPKKFVTRTVPEGTRVWRKA